MNVFSNVLVFNHLFKLIHVFINVKENMLAQFLVIYVQQHVHIIFLIVKNIVFQMEIPVRIPINIILIQQLDLNVQIHVYII